MVRPESGRRLIVNADDFGLSSSINRAVLRAHRDGILTSASLMVNEGGFAEAVEVARENPKLGVGLHLTLLCGHPSMPPETISDLVGAQDTFGKNPITAGFRYFVRQSLREQLQQEIRAQFQKFHATGLPLDHVNGHLHFHLHPTIFAILMQEAPRLGIRHLRLTRDPFWLNARLASGEWFRRIAHGVIFAWLGGRARPALRQRGIQHTENVFGLLQNARVDEAYVTGLVSQLPPGDSELYSHPSLGEFRHEFDALVSPRVRALVEKLGIRLIRYQDL